MKKLLLIPGILLMFLLGGCDLCPDCQTDDKGGDTAIEELIDKSDPTKNTLPADADPCAYCEKCGTEIEKENCYLECSAGINTEHPCYKVNPCDPCDHDGSLPGSGEGDPPDPDNPCGEEFFAMSKTYGKRTKDGKIHQIKVSYLNFLSEKAISKIYTDLEQVKNKSNLTYFDKKRKQYTTFIRSKKGNMIALTYSDPEVLKGSKPWIFNPDAKR